MFGGRCDEALDFHTRALGAKVEMVIRYRESPDPVPEGTLAPGFEHKIMHSSFLIGGSRVMASDGCSEAISFSGVTLSLSVADEAAADKAFHALAEGGGITMPLTKTFWSLRFGMLTDKFGLDWMVSVGGGLLIAPPTACTACTSPRRWFPSSGR